MLYKIYIKDMVVHKTTDKKKALRALSKIMKNNNDVYLYGGKIGTWMYG